jgi:hypothetical protein
MRLRMDGGYGLAMDRHLFKPGLGVAFSHKISGQRGQWSFK